MSGVRAVELVRVGPGPVGDQVWTTLQAALAARLGASVARGAPLEDVGFAADDDQAHDSGLLVDALIRSRPDPGGWVLGVTASDLRATDRQYVFGEATVGGHWALVGLARFGIPATPSPALLRRVVTEALHELGHLARLAHCPDPLCAMSRSATVAEVDRKKSEFCVECAARIRPGGAT